MEPDNQEALMQLSAIGLSRVIALFELAELNPQGRVFVPSLISPLVNRFSFQKKPEKFEDFDLSKGVSFEFGYFGDTTITKLSFYNDGISLDTRSHTQESQQVVFAILEWLASEYGLNYHPRLIKRWAYVTNVTFYSDADLTLLNPVMAFACQRLSELAADGGSGSLGYRVTRVAMDCDKSVNKIHKVSFVLERSLLTRFEDNKYFAEAPLKSDDLLTLLEEIEAGILRSR
jgi:hypothetical protein